MALMKCPECGKDVSDRAVSCPNCGCPISLDTNIGIEKNTEDNEMKVKMNTKYMIISYIVFVVALICVFVFVNMNYDNLFIGSFVVAVISFYIARFFKRQITGVNSSDANSNYVDTGNSMYQMNIEPSEETIKGSSEIRKKSIVTRKANKVGRRAMTMATGGLWLLTPKRSKYKEVYRFKKKK